MSKECRTVTSRADLTATGKLQPEVCFGFVFFLYVFLDWFIERPSEKHCSEMSFGRLWFLAASDLNATGISGGLCCAELHSVMAETLVFGRFLTMSRWQTALPQGKLYITCSAKSPFGTTATRLCRTEGLRGMPQPLRGQVLHVSSHMLLPAKAVFLHAIRPAGNSQKISVFLSLA